MKREKKFLGIQERSATEKIKNLVKKIFQSLETKLC